MSHIFDALQRSEGNRAKSEGSPSLAATELLERVEQEAASQWIHEAAVAEPAVAVSELSDGMFGSGLGADSAATGGSAAASKLAAADSRLVFSQIRTIHVSLPAHTRLICMTDGDSPALEAFRLLSVRLRHMRRERPLKTVLVTSTIPQEGKSMVAANLACAVAMSAGQKVLLLEGDVRKPSLSKILGIEPPSGLSNCMQGNRSLNDSIFFLDKPGFWLMPAGTSRSGSLEFLQSPQLPGLMEQIVPFFDWVIIDSPPVLPLADTSVWARLSDGILLVTRRGTTDKRQLIRGIDALDPAKLIGAVMNSSTTLNEKYYYYRHSPAEAEPPVSSDSQ
ncbi:MAG TPA: CpsD/CapB family tyrosine-protein kinase [Acidobacteriaceae bacterium]